MLLVLLLLLLLPPSRGLGGGGGRRCSTAIFGSRHPFRTSAASESPRSRNSRGTKHHRDPSSAQTHVRKNRDTKGSSSCGTSTPWGTTGGPDSAMCLTRSWAPGARRKPWSTKERSATTRRSSRRSGCESAVWGGVPGQIGWAESASISSGTGSGESERAMERRLNSWGISACCILVFVR